MAEPLLLPGIETIRATRIIVEAMTEALEPITLFGVEFLDGNTANISPRFVLKSVIIEELRA